MNPRINKDGIINYVQSISIPAWSYDNIVLCAACNYAEGTELLYGTLYCTSCANRW